MASSLRATAIMRNNIRALLAARKEGQADLARWLHHTRSWINKFLNGERQMQMKDLDRVADFFGIATYQLFQPGISALTERRRQDRRVGRERRVGHAARHVQTLRDEVDPFRPSAVAKSKTAQKARLRLGDPVGDTQQQAPQGDTYVGQVPSAEELGHIAAQLAQITERLTPARPTGPKPDRPMAGTGTDPSADR